MPQVSGARVVSVRAILDAFQAQLMRDGFADLRLEHVAAQAGVDKATIYRRSLKTPG